MGAYTNTTSDAIAEAVRAGDKVAASEAIVRMMAGGTPEDEREVLRLALERTLIDSPETDEDEEADERTHRPYESTFTRALCKLAREGDEEAWAEIKVRWAHKDTLRERNRAMIKATRKVVKKARKAQKATGEWSCEAQPEKKARTAKAASPATQFSQRVKKLAAAAGRTDFISLGINAHLYARDEGWSAEDVAALSDADCLALAEDILHG